MSSLVMALNIQCFTVGMFSVNTYLLSDIATGKSAIIDTGESEELLQLLLKQQGDLDVSAILLTHGHIDHAGREPLAG